MKLVHYKRNMFDIILILVLENGFAQFHLMKETDRQILQKELEFPWKTDAFKNKIKVCYFDA